jgi:hypothetical protein
MWTWEQIAEFLGDLIILQRKGWEEATQNAQHMLDLIPQLRDDPALADFQPFLSMAVLYFRVPQRDEVIGLFAPEADACQVWLFADNAGYVEHKPLATRTVPLDAVIPAILALAELAPDLREEPS